LLRALTRRTPMLLHQLYDRETWTYTYLVADEVSRQAVLIDPVFEQAERDLALVTELGLILRYALDTHVHADHVTASGLLRERTGAKTVASVRGAACADLKLQSGDRLELGTLVVEVLATPGHTDDSVSYRIGSHVFTGDALLVRGTGRSDFQNGNSTQLYRSLQEVLFALPPETTVWPGHDYRGFSKSTIGDEMRYNPRVAGKSKDEFIQIMDNLGLPQPAQMDRAVPRNQRCGAVASDQQEPDAKVRDVEVADLTALAGKARIIDVRGPDEFEGELGHIEGAELVPLDTLERAQPGWDKKTPLLIVCRSGRRSLTAAELLVKAGFEQVMNLRGGMIAYRAQHPKTT
jgi:glyoxylase-like metal-dependent hydrolase (beta-lactamase superfamily II)/rhodanese-related sulfurtransferase